MRRRDLITLLTGAAAWPMAARAQQPAMPVIGFLSYATRESDLTLRLTGLRLGLNETGYIEGRNLLIEYRSAGNQPDRLPELAAQLVKIPVAVIIPTGAVAAFAAKAATNSIPIVFLMSGDPVQLGLVASLNRPQGNLTGISTFFTVELASKRLALLRELAHTPMIGFLENPNNPVNELAARDVLAAAATIGVQVQRIKVSTIHEIDIALESLVRAQIGALLVNDDALLVSQMEQIVALAARHTIPTMYPLREYVVAGGLMSYGTSLTDAYRQAGLYTGRILKGEKPADLPVVQPSHLPLVINLKTAKALGLTVPDRLLALADEVIE